MHSAGYQKVVRWISRVWEQFDPQLIRDSFHSCGIVSVDNLHFPLASIVAHNILVADYVDNDDSADEELNPVSYYFLSTVKIVEVLSF
jgi:hypothetical protein